MSSSVVKLNMENEDDFAQFLSAQRAGKLSNGSSSKRKELWLGKVESLYGLVTDILSPYTALGLMEIKRCKVDISEELLGTYSIDSLTIDPGENDLRFLPVGTYLLGSPGRVDMVGPKGTVRFVLVLPDMESPNVSGTTARGGSSGSPVTSPLDIPAFKWKISTLPPRIRYRKVDVNSLQAAIIEATNGRRI